MGLLPTVVAVINPFPFVLVKVPEVELVVTTRKSYVMACAENNATQPVTIASKPVLQQEVFMRDWFEDCSLDYEFVRCCERQQEWLGQPGL